MFLVRSAFWLTLGFLLVAPTVGADVGALAAHKAQQIAAEGRNAVRDGVSGIACESVECAVGRAVVVSALEPSGVQSGLHPMQDTPHAGPVPVPPRRPDWAS